MRTVGGYQRIYDHIFLVSRNGKNNWVVQAYVRVVKLRFKYATEVKL